jgi:hypothetical protein
LEDWDAVRWFHEGDLNPIQGLPLPTDHSNVVVTSVLTHELADFITRGGAVILLTSKWPGALGSYHHYFWRDAVFVPPVGPWTGTDCDRIIDLQYCDLNTTKSQVISLSDLGITEYADTLLRLFDTHDLQTVVVYDQLVATRAGDGLLVASSLDHSTQAGQWVLGELAAWAAAWLMRTPVTAGKSGRLDEFPATELPAELLHKLAVNRANGIQSLEHNWRFSLDPDQVGEQEGWMSREIDDSGWDLVRAGTGWERLGYSYDGMAWYRRWIEVPEDWTGANVRLIADGIDDAYTVWVNGSEVNTHGSFTVHEETVWLKQTVTDLTGYLVPGEANLLVLQVVDIVGQGGIWKPVYLAAD